MRIKKIESRKELDELFKQINKQGFGYFSSYNAHKNKIDNIIFNANVMNIDDYNIREMIDDDDTYTNISKMVKKYFSKFSNIDKIKEYLNKFYLIVDSSSIFPSDLTSKKVILDWIKFKKKYKIPKDPINPSYRVTFYNFDKIYIKINDYSYSWRDFVHLYKLLFNDEPKENIGNSPETGIWYDLGEIEIKYFQNGTMNIKGNINKLKELYYEKIKSYSNMTTIIKINNKYEYF